MLRSEELAKERWALSRQEFKSMGEEALLYLKFTGLEELADKRDKINRYDIGWAQMDIDFAAEHPEENPSERETERLAKAHAKIAAAHEVLLKLDEHEAAILKRVAEAPTFEPGTRVRICEDILEMVASPCSTCPEVGIIGVVEEMGEYDRSCQKIPGRVAVRIANDLLGYGMDEDYPEDDDENSIRYFLWPYQLEAVGDDVQTLRPYDRQPVEPGDDRWTIILDDGSELAGHDCDSTGYDEVKRYVENTGVGHAALFRAGSDNIPHFTLPREGMKWAVFMPGELHDVGGHCCPTLAELRDYAKRFGMEIREIPITDLDRQIGSYVRC
jgi:hypothetical protein